MKNGIILISSTILVIITFHNIYSQEIPNLPSPLQDGPQTFFTLSNPVCPQKVRKHAAPLCHQYVFYSLSEPYESDAYMLQRDSWSNATSYDVLKLLDPEQATEQCKAAMIRLYCMASFQRCVPHEKYQNTYKTLTPCQNLCNDVTFACKDEGRVSYDYYTVLCKRGGKPQWDECNDGREPIPVWIWIVSGTVGGVVAVGAIGVGGIAIVLFIAIKRKKSYKRQHFQTFEDETTPRNSVQYNQDI
jgi:hypothetical protein